MDLIWGRLQKSSVIYRCPDDIKNFKIRIKIRRLKKDEDQKGQWIEKEFSWQEKRFSRTQKELYKDAKNCYSELEKKFHENIGTLDENQDADWIFSYVSEENYISGDEVYSEISHLNNKMEKFEIGNAIEVIDEYDFEKSLQKSLEDPFFKSDVESMLIMVDLGNTWLKDEKTLCEIKYNASSKVLSIYPDFSSTQPYIWKIQKDDTQELHYFIEHASEDISESLKTNEESLIQKINSQKDSLKKQILSNTFSLPPKNKLNVFVFLEITCGKRFEYPNVFVQYLIDLPQGWTCTNFETLKGRTQMCKGVNQDCLVHFGHPVEVVLECNVNEFGQKDLPKSPYVYFEVISKDSWDRYRTEGLCYQMVPVGSSGKHAYNMRCVRLTTRNYYASLRRFFIGDCQNYDDVTWCGIPSDFEGKVLNKISAETVGTGELSIEMNIVHQSQAFMEQYNDGSELNYRKRNIIDKLGSSSLIKSVEEVIKEFRKARKTMIEAKKDI